MKILRPASGTGGVFFPKETCEFATEKCLKHCCVNTKKEKELDEEVNISEKDKKKIYNKFMKMPILNLCEMILDDLDGLQTNIIHWFSSGDCKSKDIVRILEIIDRLDDAGVIQMGFTRNEELWRTREGIFILTIESKKEIAHYLDNYHGSMRFAVPNYKTGKTKLFRGEDLCYGACGSYTYKHETKEIEHLVNCKSCLRLEVGCFMGRS